jgi:hypothetical protein
MSQYFLYYLGYKKGDKIYPYGPYTAEGKLKPISSRSRSFASHLYEDFWRIQEENISDELRKDFEYENGYTGKMEISKEMRWLPIKDISVSSDFMKSGYFLLDEIMHYEANKEDLAPQWVFTESLTPTAYAALATANPTEAKQYAYYAYTDLWSEEYDAFIIRNMADELDMSYFEFDKDKQDREPVVIFDLG